MAEILRRMKNLNKQLSQPLQKENMMMVTTKRLDLQIFKLFQKFSYAEAEYLFVFCDLDSLKVTLNKQDLLFRQQWFCIFYLIFCILYFCVLYLENLGAVFVFCGKYNHCLSHLKAGDAFIIFPDLSL